MSSPIQWPEFAEGEILHAEDLNAGFAQGRARDARHLRQAHRWGIVEGLELVGSPSPMGYEVTLTKGVARDVRGREIVVPDDQLVAPPSSTIATADKDLLFPVFLSGSDEPSDKNQLAGLCGTQAGQRTTERFSIEVGRVAEIDDWETSQSQASLEDGPEPSASQDPPRVLVGFVKRDPSTGGFWDVAPRSTSGVTPRRAGARANVVETTDGKVLLVLGPDKTNQDRLLAVKAAKGNELMTLTSKGDLLIQGVFSSPNKQGLHFVSGVAFDGVKLPLPAGMTETDVASYDLHVTLTPLYDASVHRILDCSIDEDRRLRCFAVYRDAPIPWAARYSLVFEPGSIG